MKKPLTLFISIILCCQLSAQTYDPYAVQVINNLIANNGLEATPDAPENWEFATWNEETPKQIEELNLFNRDLIGKVSLAELSTLIILYCDANFSMIELDVTNCTQLHLLDCTYCRSLNMLNATNCTTLQTLLCGACSLTEIKLTNCKQLWALNCCYNYRLRKLDVTNCTQLGDLVCHHNCLTELDVSNLMQLSSLHCSENQLTKLNVTNCIQMQYLSCFNNYLTELDLTGENNLIFGSFVGYGQSTCFEMIKNGVGEYTCKISLNNPSFWNSAISYSNGVLKSTNNSVSHSGFKVQTGKPGFELSGDIAFAYYPIGINSQDLIELRVSPNPTTGQLIIDNGQLTITSIEVFDIYGRAVSTHHSLLTTHYSINISHLPAGLYFVKVFTENGVFIEKVIKK
jgi:hypothetical protein